MQRHAMPQENMRLVEGQEANDMPARLPLVA